MLFLILLITLLVSLKSCVLTQQNIKCYFGLFSNFIMHKNLLKRGLSGLGTRVPPHPQLIQRLYARTLIAVLISLPGDTEITLADITLENRCSCSQCKRNCM